MDTVVYGTYRYLTPEELEQYPRYKYVTTSESKYINGNGKTVVVPVGYLTDGWTGAPDHGISWLIHDWLYSTHLFTSGEFCSQREADNIMVKILEYENFKLRRFMCMVLFKLDPFCMFSSAWDSSVVRGPMFLEDGEDEDDDD